MRRTLLGLLALVMLWAIGGSALAYDQSYVTNGSMAAETETNSQTITKTWDSPAPNYYKLKKIPLRFSLRPAFAGATYSNDRVELYYRTCPTCGYSYWTRWTNMAFDEWVDVSALNAVGIQMRYITGSASNPNPLYVSVTWNDGSASTAQWGPPNGGLVEGVYFRGNTEACCDPVTIYGYDTLINGWRSLYTKRGNWGEWVDLRTIPGTSTAIKINRLYLHMSTDYSVITSPSYGEITQYQTTWGGTAVNVATVPKATFDVPEIIVEEPPFTPGKPTLTFDNSTAYWQQRISWTAGNNPAGTVYELWRRSFDSNGNQVADEKIYAGTALSYVTQDLAENGYFRFRVRAVDPVTGRSSGDSAETTYWTVGTPTVTRGDRSLTLNWPRVFPGVTYRVYYKASTATSWTTYTTTTATTATITGLTPFTVYETSISPVLPEGGTDWWKSPTADAAASPLWSAPQNVLASDVNATSTRIWWQIYNQNAWAIESNAGIRITRSNGTNTVTVLSGTTTAASNGGYRTPAGATYGYWGYIDQSGLTPGQPYTYTVCGLSADGTCGPTRQVVVTPRPITPTTPTLSAAPSEYQVKIDWNANANSSGTTYEVWRKTLKADGSVQANERIFTGVDTYTYTTGGSWAQEAGSYYRYQVLATVGGVASEPTSEVSYWTAPVPIVANGINVLNVSWSPTLAASTQSTNGALRITSSSCAWYSSNYFYIPNGGTTSRIRVTFNGNTGDAWGLYAYSPSYGYWWPIPQQNVPSGTYDQWIDLAYPADRLRVYTHDCGGGGAAMEVLEYVASSSTTVNVQYSTNGTTWSTYTQNNGSGAAAIPAPGSISPANKYQIALSPFSLPNGGTSWRSVNPTWYSPLWREPIQAAVGTVTQTSAQLWWATGEYSDSSRPSRNARVQISRDGDVVATLSPGSDITYSLQTRYSRYDYWTSWTDPNLAPGMTYSYSACYLNALDQCGTPITLGTVLTLPPTPDAAQMDVQFGSYGWQKTNTAGGWAEVSFEPVRTATSYKLYITGPETRTITLPAPSTTPGKYRVTDLRSGGAYTWRISAVNQTGEGGQSAALTFTTPTRADAAAPTGGTMSLNGGAAATGGTRIKVTGSASDSGSGVAGFQISNDGSNWSSTFPVFDLSQVNLVVYNGANSFFTDLGGWSSDANVWSTSVEDALAEKGGRTAKIRWDGPTTSRWQGLKMANNLTFVPGKDYTVAIRYRVSGLTTGRVGLWSNWLNGSIPIVDARHHLSTLNGTWVTETFTITAPSTANGRSITLGFDQANAGATLQVDWLTINEGRAAITPTNTLPNPASGTADWEIDGSAFGAKTVRVRFVDMAGNISTAISDTIQFMLTDTTSPRVSLSINGGALTTDNTSVTLSITATDAESSQDALKIRMSNDGRHWSDWEDYAPLKAWTICTLSPDLCEGQRQVWVQVQDPAKNVGSAVAQIFFRVSIAPISDNRVLWSTTGNAGSYNIGSGSLDVQFVRLTEATVNLDLTKLSGVKTIRYGFDQQRLSQPETVAARKTIVLAMTEGIQTLYMMTDAGETYSIKFLLDLTPPEVSVAWKGNATATRPGGLATLVITANDNLARSEDLQVSINGGSWIPWQAEIPVTLTGSGLTNVTVRVMDPAGNIVTRNLTLFVL